MKRRCKFCHKWFEVTYRRSKDAKFCNRECYNNFIRASDSIPAWEKSRVAWNKGKKMPNLSKKRMRDGNPMWKGGKTKRDGYILVKCYDKKSKYYKKYIPEHRLVMEKNIGRYLTEDEVVHHKNGIKDDNRIENLELMTFGEHQHFEKLGSKNPRYGKSPWNKGTKGLVKPNSGTFTSETAKEMWRKRKAAL